MRTNDALRVFRWVIRLVVPTAIRDATQKAHLRRQHGLIFTGDTRGAIQIVGSRFGRHCRIGAPIYIGDSFVDDYSYLEPYCRVSSTNIGKFCSIATFCVIGPLSHPMGHVSTHPAFFLRSERFAYLFVRESNDASQHLRTTVGNDVWMGSGVFIRRGVSVGDGAVIGAGAVVTKDVPPYSVVGGVPARIIRMRFDDKTIERLTDLRWWDKDDGWLCRYADSFADIEQLLSFQHTRYSPAAVGNPVQSEQQSKYVGRNNGHR